MTQAAAAPIDRPFSSSAAPVGSFILLTCRILLGGLFCFAASMKIRDPQTFLEAIQAFKVPLSNWWMLFGTYAIPWIEMLAGIALIVGLWSRAAALVLIGLLGVFIGALAHIIPLIGDKHIPCSCFGRYELFCTGGVSWCKVRENCGLIALGLVPMLFGGGRLSLDWLLYGREPRT